MDEDRLLMSYHLGTVSETARELDIDGARVWELVAAGELRAERDGLSGPWHIWRDVTE